MCDPKRTIASPLENYTRRGLEQDAERFQRLVADERHRAVRRRPADPLGRPRERKSDRSPASSASGWPRRPACRSSFSTSDSPATRPSSFCWRAEMTRKRRKKPARHAGGPDHADRVPRSEGRRARRPRSTAPRARRLDESEHGKSKLILGCGYLGRRVAERWRAAGDEVFVVTRDPQRAEKFAAQDFARSWPTSCSRRASPICRRSRSCCTRSATIARAACRSKRSI